MLVYEGVPNFQQRLADFQGMWGAEEGNGGKDYVTLLHKSCIGKGLKQMLTVLWHRCNQTAIRSLNDFAQNAK